MFGAKVVNNKKLKKFYEKYFSSLLQILQKNGVQLFFSFLFFFSLAKKFNLHENELKCTFLLLNFSNKSGLSSRKKGTLSYIFMQIDFFLRQKKNWKNLFFVIFSLQGHISPKIVKIHFQPPKTTPLSPFSMISSSIFLFFLILISQT